MIPTVGRWESSAHQHNLGTSAARAYLIYLPACIRTCSQKYPRISSRGYPFHFISDPGGFDHGDKKTMYSLYGRQCNCYIPTFPCSGLYHSCMLSSHVLTVSVSVSVSACASRFQLMLSHKTLRLIIFA